MALLLIELESFAIAILDVLINLADSPCTILYIIITLHTVVVLILQTLYC